MRNVALAAAFERYQMSAHQSKGNTAKLSRVTSKMVHARLVWTFDFWHEATTEKQQSVSLAADDEASSLLKQMLKVERDRNKDALEREAQRRFEICARIVKRMLAAHLACSFDSYVDTVAERIRKRAVVKRVVRRIQYRELAQAFGQYSGIVAQRNHRRELIRCVLGRMQQAQVLVAFGNWLESHGMHRQEITDEGLELAKEKMTGEFETETERIMYERIKYAESLRHKQLQEDLEGERHMHKVAAEKEAQRRVEACTRTVKRMLALQLAAAFDSYVHIVADRINKRCIIQRVLCRIQHGQLALAFDRYSGIIHHTLNQRASCSKVVRRMLHARLGAAYAHWLDYVKDCQIGVAQQAIDLAKQQMAGEIQSHRDLVEHEQEERIQQEKERQMVVSRRIVQKMINAHRLQAWNSFVSTVAQRKHRRELIRRVLGRMQHMMLAAAFDGLDTAVDLAIAQREAVAKAIQRWRMPRLQWGFDLMVQYLEVQQAEIKERAYQQAKQAMEGQLDQTIESNKSVLQNELQEHEDLLRREKE